MWRAPSAALELRAVAPLRAEVEEKRATMSELDRDLTPIRCHACERPTRGGKPYCSRHVFRMPYVHRVLAGLRAQPRFLRPSRWVHAEDVFLRRARA